MMIPEAVERGKPAVIKCMYDLEKEDLYQVKWYRGDREFCRYSPRDVPPLKVFPISGIDVDVSILKPYSNFCVPVVTNILITFDLRFWDDCFCVFTYDFLGSDCIIKKYISRRINYVVL